MSLFKAREWWATTVGEDEEYDLGCLCTANIDNHSDGLDKIIVGSYHGFLRIYSPKPAKLENGWSGFKPEDVVCETQLQFPILQIEAGRFLSGSDNIHLAILHPRKISVYSLVGKAGAVEHGTHYQLKLAYEHNLQRTAFNFCYGPFGGVKTRDFLCVQSMDGTLSVFEQESFAFSRFLPGALLPGPIKYLRNTDSFVTVSSSRQVESYKFQVLAVATDTKTKEESQGLKSGKRVAFDWAFNTGEQAIDLIVATFPGASTAIYVLGERSMFILSESGKLRHIKKLEFNPSCFLPYTSVSQDTIQCLVGTHTNTLMVYQDITLKWAAQLTHPPVQVRVANLADLKGAIVALDEAGHLICVYMGTDPAMFTTPTAEVREIDYAELDHEMQQLQKVIKAQSGKAMAPLPTQAAEDEVSIQIHVPPNLDDPPLSHDTEIQDEERIPSVTVKIALKAKSHINDVKVAIHPVLPLGVNESLITFASLEPSHPGETQVTFYMKYPLLPSELKAEVTATYQSASGAPRVVTAGVRLPVKLVLRAAPPVKQANFKVTLDTNKPPVSLNDIFPDLLGENAGGAGNALGFKYYGMEPVVTLLASKTSQRYRLQCDEFSFLWLLINELVTRLNGYFKKGTRGSDFRITFEGPLPLQEYFDVLDFHFEFRAKEEDMRKLLEERACQFRAIQRRLLTRFKDKTPAPLANLDTLLDGTYRQLLALGEAAEDNRQQQLGAAAALSCATRVLNVLVRLWQDMSNEEFSVLEAAVSPVVEVNGQQGWEEMADAAITHLLRTCLAKSAKDQTVNPSPLTIMKDTTKLKKHIALLCDRLSKGAKLAVEGQAVPAYKERTPEPAAAPRKSKKNPVPDLDSMSTSSMEDSEPLSTKYTAKKSPRGRKAKELPLTNGRADTGQPRDLGPRGDVSPMGAPLGGDLAPLGGDLAPLGGNLAPLGGSKDLPPLGGANDLPPLGGANDLPPLGGGNKYKKKPRPEDIPDLDDMETDTDGALMNGTDGEMVYGL